jgi:arylsulfatase A-like enzyme
MDRQMITRREILKKGTALGLTGLASAVTGCSVAQQASSSRPNVLLIMTDQQTVNTMSAAGNLHVRTPAMDSLAGGGVRFEHSYCTSPVCGPSRSSIITGRMPHETGVNWNVDTPRAIIPNVGEIFRAAGYRTIWAGKWHLPRMYPHKFWPDQSTIQGFELPTFMDFEQPRWDHAEVTDPPLTRWTVDFLNNYESEDPFFLTVSYHDPHDICFYPYAPERFRDPDEIEELPPLPPNHLAEDQEPEFVQARRNLGRYGDQLLRARDWEEKRWRSYIYEYYRMVERVDAEIGQVLEALRANGLEENTLILFTSDHGDGVGAHRWVSKLSFYEEPITVPFFVSWKGQIGEEVVDDTHVVSGVDIVPTLCDYAGVPLPPVSRGLSLKRVIEDPTADWREFIVAELADDNVEKDRRGRMVRSAQFKYNLYSHGARNEQLFDLAKDPGEMQNLALDESMREVKLQHREMLRKWLDETQDDFKLHPEADVTKV